MPTQDFRLEALSPMFVAGTDKAHPEWRAPTVRGHLRYWLRALLGTATDSVNAVWQAEESVFGSTGRGSAVTVQIWSDVLPITDRYPMMPHKHDLKEVERSQQKATSPGQRARLRLVTRPGTALPQMAWDALKVWSLLGGMGRRSRRMFGAMELSTSSDHWYPSPRTPEELASTIRNTLDEAVHHARQSMKSASVAYRGIPRFPTLHPDHSWVIVSTQGYPLNDYEEANKDLFRDLLRNSTYQPRERSFGYARGGRRASTVIAQLRRINDQLYPVLTAIRSQPDRDIDWGVVNRFMQDAAAHSHYKAQTAWGGPWR